MAGNLFIYVLFYGHMDEDAELFLAAAGIYRSDSDRAGSDRTGRQAEDPLWKDRTSPDRLSDRKVRIRSGDRSSRAIHILNHVPLFCIDPAGADPCTGGSSGSDFPEQAKRRLICCFDKDSQCGRTFGGECSDRRESGELLLYSADDIGCTFLLGNCPEGGGTRSAQCAGRNRVYHRNRGISVCLKDINDCKLLGKISFDAVFSLFLNYT